jgi:HEAT repeat protein
LEVLLDDVDAPVRVAAAVVLARLRDARALQTLLNVVSGELGPVDAEDEAAAVELAGDLGMSEAVPHLERRAFGLFPWSQGRFAWQAMVSLAKMGHQRARSRIVRDLGAWSRDRRTLAVAAVGQARLVDARPLVAAMRGDARRAEPSAVSLTLDELGAVAAEQERALS